MKMYREIYSKVWVCGAGEGRNEGAGSGKREAGGSLSRVEVLTTMMARSRGHQAYRGHVHVDSQSYITFTEGHGKISCMKSCLTLFLAVLSFPCTVHPDPPRPDCTVCYAHLL